MRQAFKSIKSFTFHKDSMRSLLAYPHLRMKKQKLGFQLLVQVSQLVIKLGLNEAGQPQSELLITSLHFRHLLDKQLSVSLRADPKGAHHFIRSQYKSWSL